MTLSSKYGKAVVGCPVLELSSVHLCGVRMGTDSHNFKSKHSSNYFPVIKGWICFHTNFNYHMKTRQESFKLFEKPPGNTAYGHLVVDSDNIHKSLH